MLSCGCDLVGKVKSDSVKNNNTLEPGMLGSTNQGELAVVKQMARVTIHMSGITELIKMDGNG